MAIAETDTKIAPIPSTKIAGNQLIVMGGTVLPENMKEVESLAQYMAKAGSAIPYSMQGNPGECMAVIMDAIAWRMNPWAVARQRYVTKSKDGHLTGGYMGQLFIAVLNTRAGLKERLTPQYTGDGPDRRCILHAETMSGQVLHYESPPFKDIEPKNSPLWKSDRDQQFFYYSGRAFGRRFFPELFMGIYDPEEVDHIARMRDVTPKENVLVDPEDAPAHVHQGEVIDPNKAAESGEAFNRWAKSNEATDIAAAMDQAAAQMDIDAKTGSADDQGSFAHDPETGEIKGMDGDPEPDYRKTDEICETRDDEREAEEQRGLALDEPDANKIKVNLLKGVKACKTKRDVEAWQQENREAWTKDRDLRKAISDRLFEIEDEEMKL